jgi:hypothetical protein
MITRSASLDRAENGRMFIYHHPCLYEVIKDMYGGDTVTAGRVLAGGFIIRSKMPESRKDSNM